MVVDDDDDDTGDMGHTGQSLLSVRQVANKIMRLQHKSVYKSDSNTDVAFVTCQWNFCLKISHR